MRSFSKKIMRKKLLQVRIFFFIYNKMFIFCRDGSGQFFTSRVGFRVFQFCSGRVSGFCIFPRVKKFWLRVQVFFKNQLNMRFSTYKSSGQMARVWQKLPRVKKKIQRVGLGPPKDCLGRVGLGKIPDPSLVKLKVYSYVYVTPSISYTFRQFCNK